MPPLPPDTFMRQPCAVADGVSLNSRNKYQGSAAAECSYLLAYQLLQSYILFNAGRMDDGELEGEPVFVSEKVLLGLHVLLAGSYL